MGKPGPNGVSRSNPAGWKFLDGTLSRVDGLRPGVEGFYRKTSKYIEDLFDEEYGTPLALVSGNIVELQKKVNKLTEKARQNRSFTIKEKKFLYDLYSWLATGGRWKWLSKMDLGKYDQGLWEAGELLQHYLDGEGKPLEIDSTIYENSVIVKYAMGKIKEAVTRDISSSGKIRNNGRISSTDVLAKTSFKSVTESGQILKGGVLLAEQGNTRLKYANNRFVLKSQSTVAENHFWQPDNVINIETVWRVDDRWDYESFSAQRKKRINHITVIPLRGGKFLKLHDGLSHYLTVMGVAKEFDYFSQWSESWSLPS